MIFRSLVAAIAITALSTAPAMAWGGHGGGWGGHGGGWHGGWGWGGPRFSIGIPPVVGYPYAYPVYQPPYQPTCYYAPPRIEYIERDHYITRYVERRPVRHRERKYRR
jgi:hypothetical protein